MKLTNELFYGISDRNLDMKVIKRRTDVVEIDGGEKRHERYKMSSSMVENWKPPCPSSALIQF